MSTDTKTVIRFKSWVHPNLIARYAQEPDIDLVTVDAANEAEAWRVMGRAHAYQIGSSRDELPASFHAHADLLTRAPSLVCISTAGAGYDTVDVAACTAAGVLVVNQAGGNARSVAEHTLGLMLDLSKRITEADRRMRAERGFPREDLMGRELAGRTLGLVGIGHVGRRVAALARAFEMTVLACDPYVDTATVEAAGARKVSFETLLAESDFVSLHCPRDETTVNMMDAKAFGQMKQGAVFITTCRGGVHNEDALVEALRSGHVSAAGLDVWLLEPPPLDHPLLQMSNVVATFHTAGVTHEARAQMAKFAGDQAIQVLRGERPPRLVNPEAWPAFETRFERIMGHRPAAGV